MQCARSLRWPPAKIDAAPGRIRYSGSGGGPGGVLHFRSPGAKSSRALLLRGVTGAKAETAVEVFQVREHDPAPGWGRVCIERLKYRPTPVSFDVLPEPRGDHSSGGGFGPRFCFRRGGRRNCSPYWRTIAAAGLRRMPTAPRSSMKVHSAAIRPTTSSGVNIDAIGITLRRSRRRP